MIQHLPGDQSRRAEAENGNEPGKGTAASQPGGDHHGGMTGRPHGEHGGQEDDRWRRTPTREGLAGLL